MIRPMTLIIFVLYIIVLNILVASILKVELADQNNHSLSILKGILADQIV